MTTPITIRRGAEHDAAAIAAFQQAMALETEGKALDSTVIDAGVRGLMANPAWGFYLIAERGGEVAGSLMVTPEWSDWRGGLFWWIQSVYIDRAHRRSGVYRTLYDEVRDQARAAGNVIGVRLYVERENEAARAVYTNLGMDETPYRLYEASL